MPLNDKDFLDFLLKLASDASANARHAETAQNQYTTMFFTTLLAILVLRSNPEFLSGVGAEFRNKVTFYVIPLMVYFALSVLHRSQVAIEERDRAEGFRMLVRHHSSLDIRLHDAEMRVDKVASLPMRRFLIEKLSALTGGPSIAIYLLITAIILMFVFAKAGA